jgi:hypothetical protein
MITPASFIVQFPEFTSTATATVQIWINQAYSQLAAYPLGDQLDYAASLFTAHNLSLAIRRSTEGASGAVPGTTVGILASKSVGGASASYDTGSSTAAGAGIYNTTVYGQMLWPLLRGSIAGPIYVPASFDVTAQRGLRGFPFRRRGFLGF